MKIRKEYIFAGISIIFWGSSAAVSALMLESLSSFAVLFYGSILASAFLFVLCALTGRLKKLKEIPLKDWIFMIALGVLGMFLYNWFVYMGLQRLKAQQAFIINYLWPILIVLFSCVFLGQKMNLRKSVALLLSFIGVAIVATEGSLQGLGDINLFGVAACLAAAVSYALFSVFNIKVTCDKFAATMIYYATSAILSLILLLTGEGIPMLSLPQWGGMLWYGVLVSGVSYSTWALALDHGDTAKISNLAYITPFVSLVYTYFLLGEAIVLSSFVGLGFIIAGVIIQMERSPKSDKTESAA